jgi:4-amino-4-deoxy-L-arabinose transferase-like glycosyltransferase
MLVPGVWIGFPMLLPRLLAGVSVLATWAIGRRLGLARPAWGAWALALSPAFLGVEALNLAHGTSLPFLLLFTWAALAAIDGESIACACAAGLAFSIAFAARPLTAVALGVPVLALLVRERPRHSARLLACALAAAVPVALLFLEFDRRLTGSAFRTVYGTFMTTDVSVYGSIEATTAASISAFNLSRLSVWLVGLAPGLLLPALALAAGRPNRRAWFVAALPASLFAFYVLHPFHGIPWVGPVYLSDALPYLALLVAEGLVVVETAFGATASRAAWAFFACGSVVLLAAHFGLAREEIAERQRPYVDARKAGIERGVVFLSLTTPHDWRTYPLAPPEPGAALVFARDLGPRNAELVHALGDPPAWTWDPATGELRPGN